MDWAYVQVDAFTDERYGGNPCAVVFDAEGLGDAQMQKIAREMNLSETAFVLPPAQGGDVRARYFTPGAEIPMAGHPTVAVFFALFDTARLRPSGETTSLRLELPAGIIPVDVTMREGEPIRVVMTQLAPQFLARYEAKEVLPLFGLTADAAHPALPVQVVSTGTPQLMIPLRDHGALRQAELDTQAFRAALPEPDFFSVHLFCTQGVTPAGGTFARHFCPPPDLFEDPFTGSATGSMAALLWQQGALPAPRFVAEQGHWMGRPGRAEVEVLGPPGAIEGVRVGGTAVTVMRGTLTT